MLSGPLIAQIASVASLPLSRDKPEVPVQGERGSELQVLLEARNGFFAFESALHVFPSLPLGRDETAQPMSAERWNAPHTWKREFDGMAEGLWCFAEDVFGVQFAVRGDIVVSFDPETGEVQHVADDIGGWIEALMSDYQPMTGYPLANAWQREHGSLGTRMRLLPKIPFVLGGNFDISNLFAEDAVEVMRVRGHLAVQIRDLPDGSPIEYLPTF